MHQPLFHAFHKGETTLQQSPYNSKPGLAKLIISIHPHAPCLLGGLGQYFCTGLRVHNPQAGALQLFRKRSWCAPHLHNHLRSPSSHPSEPAAWSSCRRRSLSSELSATLTASTSIHNCNSSQPSSDGSSSSLISSKTLEAFTRWWRRLRQPHVIQPGCAF